MAATAPSTNSGRSGHGNGMDARSGMSTSAYVFSSRVVGWLTCAARHGRAGCLYSYACSPSMPDDVTNVLQSDLKSFCHCEREAEQLPGACSLTAAAFACARPAAC